MHESPLIGYGFFGEVLELFLTYVFVYIKYPYLYWVWSIFSQIFFSNGILVIFWRYSTFFALPILNWVFWHVLSTVLLLSIYLANKWQSDVCYIIILHRCLIHNTLLYYNLNLSLWLSTDIYTEAHWSYCMYMWNYTSFQTTYSHTRMYLANLDIFLKCFFCHNTRSST